MATVHKATENTKGATKKTYKLTSVNKFLTVSSLGVQFMSGKYETSDSEVVKALINLDGVELVEE